MFVKKKERILFICSCLQSKPLFLQNVVELHKRVAEFGDDAEIYLLTSTDTLKLILPDRVNFFVEKITKRGVKRIVNDNRINVVYPFAGDCDDIVRGLQRFFKKKKVKNVYNTFYTKQQTKKDLRRIAKRIGFGVSRRRAKVNSQGGVFVNFVCIKDDFGNQIVLDAFEDCRNEKASFYCSSVVSADYNLHCKIRWFVDELGKAVYAERILYCIKIHVVNDKIFFDDIKYEGCDEVVFFLQKSAFNKDEILSDIDDNRGVFYEVQRDIFSFSSSFSRTQLIHRCKSSGLVGETFFSYYDRGVACHRINDICSAVSKGVRELTRFYKKNCGIFHRNNDARVFGENLLLVDNETEESDINERLVSFHLYCELCKVSGCRVVYLSNRISPLVNLLPNCVLMIFGKGNINGDYVDSIVRSFSIKNVYLCPVKNNIEVLKIVTCINGLHVYGIGKDFRFYQDNELRDFCDECRVAFQCERFDRQQKVINFSCVKDQYNNIVSPVLFSEEFLDSEVIYCDLYPVYGADYGCEAILFRDAVKLLDKIRFSGTICIVFIYDSGQVFVKDIIFSDCRMFLLGDYSRNFLFSAAVKGIMGANILSSSSGSKENTTIKEHNFRQTILINCEDGQKIVATGTTLRRTIADYKKRFKFVS